MENKNRLFNIAFAAISLVVFVIVAIRCATVPFHHDEVATFYYYIQTGDFLPYHAHLDANNHVLNSLLSWICFTLFGDSPFSLRLPNLLSLLVLIFAVYRISKQLTQTHAKFVLLAGFLVSFHWLSFFSTCRGYGISMAFLVLGLSYLIEYFSSKQILKLTLFFLCLQIAITANLIFVILIIVLSGFIVLFQLLNKVFFKVWNIVIHAINAALVLYWLRFSFFLQAHGALYYGQGKGYWKVTFVSLLQLLTGTGNKWIAYFCVFCFVALLICVTISNLKNVIGNIKQFFTPSPFYTFLVATFIVAFYAMKKLMHINYPEDRTGLFFYVFFILGLAFTLDQHSNKINKSIAYFICSLAVIHFAYYINFRKHSLITYNTIPERFYDRLVDEQKTNPERITIAGHRLLELFYGFINYRHNALLNPVDAPDDSMQMNCDYAIIWKEQEKYYMPYYSKLDEDKDWGYELLKRKEPVKRNLILTLNNIPAINSSNEFTNLYSAVDTVIPNRNPLLFEISTSSIKAEMPMQAWIVLEVDTGEDDKMCYKRISLNWLRYNWNNVTNQQLCLVTAELPPKAHKLVLYFWNAWKKDISIHFNYLKVYRLEGNGIDKMAPIP